MLKSKIDALASGRLTGQREPLHRLEPALAMAVLFWNIQEKKSPRGWDPVLRRANLQKDVNLVSKMVPHGIAFSPLILAGRPAHFYIPHLLKPRQMFLYLHGGGYVLGSLDTADSFCRLLCMHTNSVVVSLDYRLSPESTFPAALEDALGAWLDLQRLNDAGTLASLAEVLGSPLPGQLPFLVIGDSAGGHLATTLCLKLGQLGLKQPDGQVLLYPVTNLASLDTESYRRFANGYILEKADMEWFRDCYVPDEELRADPLVSPLLAPEVGHLPPALVLTADHDVLRDEGEAWAARLRQAEVPVWQYRLPGVIHGFASLTAVGTSWLIAMHLIKGFLSELRKGRLAKGGSDGSSRPAPQ
ncbi:MAG: hypothetical protein A2087_04840 [Spirochaetes bacterium GWD1_61_31]|nr:MAG: hypothetical protein A2Y37_01620 [Spirochaetes bacterium GWB1_60_80]OHD34913.1 MAG: hypothetical protein A2004_00650 [Spirochaetes bacterium GWC1_61_12]OHD37058.1 MAG: hypothetical protein A2087_04840 [Spirochaetes bacterium GWD1_61_31]OHD45332.1 MAG: hypothetical protein A2Y35_00550 [Spirochaetes bacterium GWE1_60_18]OHD61084.1 MAG: hypothetical protein A2Y32_09235 [Spirochaetes bacterium GWF1_60_12]HAP42745.1 hypothetical protein [Spirochaetaceae bacterium]